jgi:hypothetical protein
MSLASHGVALSPMSVLLNPLEVEQRYQELVLSLSLPATPYQRLAAIASFLRFLGDVAPVYESHVIDVAERFRSCVQNLYACGHAPDLLEQIAGVIDAGFRRTDGAMEVEGVEAGLDRMKFLCALAYANVASWKAVFRILNSPAPADLDLAALRPGDAGLRQIQEAIPAGDRSLREQVEDIRTMIVAETHVFPQTAWFPVVERQADTRSQHSGTLRQVSARILGHSSDGHDSVTADVAVLGVGDTGNGVTDIPMHAVRAWLRRRGVPDDEPMAGQVSFGGAQALHEGNSSDLAIAVVLGCAVLRHNRERLQYRICQGVAFTGGLTAEGMLEQVDEATLRLKVEAAFCSSLQVLVVPRGQAETADACVRELQQRYPLRMLEIVGVRMLDDAFYDLRVIEPERASLVMHAVRTVWGRKSRFVALVSTSVLIVLGAWYVISRMDPEPLHIEYAGDRLRVLNRYGFALSEIVVGKGTVEQWGGTTNEWEVTRGSLLADLDGDGTKDLLYMQTYGDGAQGEDHVVAWSVRNDQRLWSANLRPYFDFPERTDVKAGGFHANDIAAADVDGDGRDDIFVAASHTPTFPGVVLRFDPGTGAVVQTYVNTGHIPDIAIGDPDGDGTLELLVCGTNNAFNQAFVAVLDARSIEGCSPHTPAYRCISPPTGREEVYALLPRSILGTTLGTDQKGNGGMFLRVANATAQVTVCVNDNKGNVIKTPVETNSILNFAFNRTMDPVAIIPGDSYDRVATWAVEQGYLREVPSTVYFEELKSEIRLWKNGAEVKPAAP